MRSLRPCRYCGWAYQGRGIFADHGFSEYNLERHEEVCLSQQMDRSLREVRARGRAAARAGVGEGQLDLFDDDDDPDPGEDE